MSETDEIDEDDMVCGVFHASHRATSTTIQAYLAAHRPNCALAFKILTPSTDVEHLCEQVLGDAGVALRKTTAMCFVGTADPRTWTRLLLKEGELLERHSISLSPVRLGQVKRP